jgi:hypothetical protein
VPCQCRARRGDDELCGENVAIGVYFYSNPSKSTFTVERRRRIVVAVFCGMNCVDACGSFDDRRLCGRGGVVGFGVADANGYRQCGEAQVGGKPWGAPVMRIPLRSIEVRSGRILPGFGKFADWQSLAAALRRCPCRWIVVL